MVEQQPSESDDGAPAQAPPRMSAWAVAALGTSLSCFCPLLTLLGPLLAVRALVEIRANPAARSGRGMAVAALGIGAASTLLWIGGFFWWNIHVRNMLLTGPQAALDAGTAGDITGFKSAFTAGSASAPDERARAFLDEVRRRYGTFLGAAQDHAAPLAASATQPAVPASAAASSTPEATGQISGRTAVLPYVLRFEQQDVAADVSITLFARGLAPRIDWIRIKDQQRGDLRYP